jgi:GRAM domain-containing protein 4
LPALIFGIFVMLMKNHLFPYPSLDTLRRRRTEYKRADELGERIQERLSGENVFGVRDAWKLFRMLNSNPKSKTHKNRSASHSVADLSKIVASPSEQEETILDDPQGHSQEEEDLKLVGLELMIGIADLHERVKK